jgi:hypothetical protein
MKITFSTISSHKTTSVSIKGLVLTIDSVDYDLSVIPVGGRAQAPLSSPFIGPVMRDEVKIKYHYDSSLAELLQPSEDLISVIDVKNGKVPCPIKWRK